MDWKKITDAITPYINTAKEYGKKAAKFTEEQVQTTPVFIKTQTEYDTLLGEKRVIILAYEDTGALADEIRLLSSVWFLRAFADLAVLRMISITEFPDLSHANGLVGPVDMRIRFEGEETFRLTDIEAIKAWWKTPCYKKIEPKDEVPTAPVDPLIGK